MIIRGTAGYRVHQISNFTLSVGLRAYLRSCLQETGTHPPEPDVPGEGERVDICQKDQGEDILAHAEQQLDCVQDSLKEGGHDRSWGSR